MKKLILSAFPALCLAPAMAQEQEVYTLEKIKVAAQHEESGKTEIDAEKLEILPSRSDSITEALKGQSNVQFSYDTDSGLTGGEIRPARISISGAKPYENNFLIDGGSVTNILNPSGLEVPGDTPDFGKTLVQGGDQTVFYDTNLLDSVTVYTSNVPAKYGDFVGGVVDASLRDPATGKWRLMGKGLYSSSDWTNMRYVDDESDDSRNQPEYDKYDLSLRAEGPVTDKISLLASYSLKRSVIPLNRKNNNNTPSTRDDFFEKDEQIRRSENLMLRALFQASDDLKITLDGTYAPYSEKRWLRFYSDSYYENYNDVYRLAGNVNYQTDHGSWEGRIVYSQNGYSRDSDSNYYYTSQNYLTRKESRSGMIGDAESENKSIDAGVDFTSRDWNPNDAIKAGFAAGVSYNYTSTDIWNQASSMYLESIASRFFAFRNRTEYPEHSQSDDLSTAALYLQGSFAWNGLELTPGVRADYDDFTNNVDLAPRFAAEYDISGNGALRLIGGANRYYGSTLRNYAFDQVRRVNTISEYDTNGDGVYGGPGDRIPRFTGSSDSDNSMDDLDTPYSDELTAGILGYYAGFSYKVEFVRRNFKKQLISQRENTKTSDYNMTNNGESQYDSITVEVSHALQREGFGKHRFTLGATKSRRKTFNGAYNSRVTTSFSSFGIPKNYDQVYYKGKLIDRSELAADNYNAPVVVTLQWYGRFFADRFRVSSITRWRDSSTGLTDDDRESADTPFGTVSGRKSDAWLDGKGTWVDAYDYGLIEGGFNTDVTLEYDAIRGEILNLAAVVEVSNLFNDSFATRIENGYNLGRSFYAGLRANF